MAVVNKEMTRKFQSLVDGAEEFLKYMPWEPIFEKDTFLRPDFTSLEVWSPRYCTGLDCARPVCITQSRSVCV